VKRLDIVEIILTGMLTLFSQVPQAQAEDGHGRLAVLAQSLIAVPHGEALRVNALTVTDGTLFGSEQLRGRWSVIYFGFTSCPEVCPMTLSVLGALAHNPRSGVEAGTTQIVFVSVDPEHDTPIRVKHYLESFDTRIVGLTGSRDATDQFSRALGAAYQTAGAGIDHSTTLFVVDPQGRLAGFLLRPAHVERIMADLSILRAAQ
jgi:protein SCO1